jgi:hypothetical protein
MSAWPARESANVGQGFRQGRIGMAGSRLQFPNCILDNCSLCPRTRPFTKDTVSRDTIFNTTYEASLRLCGIARQQKRKLIEIIQVFTKDRLKVFPTRVSIRLFFSNLNVARFGHFFVSK